MSNIFDIVVVGSNLAGIYFTYKMQKQFSHDKLRMCLIEDTIKTAGYYWGNSISYRKLLNEIDKNVELVFPSYNCTIKEQDVLFLTKKEQQTIAQTNKHQKNIPIGIVLLRYALSLVLESQWDMFNFDTNTANHEQKKHFLRKFGVFRGRPLSDYGIRDLLESVLSKKALEIIIQTNTITQSIRLNSNAATSIALLIDMIGNIVYFQGQATIEKGIMELLHAMLRETNNKVHIISNDTVLQITCNKSRNISMLSLSSGLDIYCKKCILALHPTSVMHICGLSKKIYEILNNCMASIHMIYAYFKIHNEDVSPWGNTLYMNTFEGCDSIKMKDGTIVVYGYLDKMEEGWSTKEKAVATISKRFNLSSPIEIADFRVSKVSHTYLTNATTKDIEDALPQNIHFVGECFGDMVGYIDGSITSVDKVIDTYFTELII